MTANTSPIRFGGTYRGMVSVEGRYLIGAILKFAHARARIEFNAHTRASGEANPISYAVIFKRELRNAWQYAVAIAGAGQGESVARSVAMFAERRAA